MYLQQLSQQFPNKIAAIIADTGETATFGELYEKTAKLAHYIIKNTKKGDIIACLQKNSINYFTSLWACLESPFHLVSINWHLNRDEAKHVLDNSGSVGVICSNELLDFASSITSTQFIINEDGFDNQPVVPVETDKYGALIFYSSGTTGRPKGIVRELLSYPINSPLNYHNMASKDFDITEDSVLFSPGPFYHAAAGTTCISAQTTGAQTITTTKFDAEETLKYIEKYKVTHLMVVPTHLIRMLKLPKKVRDSYDISSLKLVVHGAAPMPIEVKEQLIKWMGPIFLEYYATSELIGYTTINTDEWLSHKGSVGRPRQGKVYVVDGNGNELPNGEVGYIVFDHKISFRYFDNYRNTSILSFGDRAGVGDIGYVDDEQYVYLTDRSNNMIITGGVNIYPQEAENVLVMHPAIKDVAVIGVPDSELGEVAKAIVELEDGYEPDEDLKSDIIYYSRKKLSLYKCPRSVDFIDRVPRTESGKLLKKELVDGYHSR